MRVVFFSFIQGYSVDATLLGDPTEVTVTEWGTRSPRLTVPGVQLPKPKPGGCWLRS